MWGNKAQKRQIMYSEVEEIYVAVVQKVCLASEFGELISQSIPALKSLPRFNWMAMSQPISIQKNKL